MVCWTKTFSNSSGGEQLSGLAVLVYSEVQQVESMVGSQRLK
jgi:hypothetical protein